MEATLTGAGSDETKAATTLDLAAYAATSDSAYSSYHYAPSIPFPPEQDSTPSSALNSGCHSLFTLRVWLVGDRSQL